MNPTNRTSVSPSPSSPVSPSGPGAADDRPVLVLGATGKTGRRVATLLDDRGVPVRRASRGSTPPFDWDDPGTWDAVLAGTRAAYVVFSPDLLVPGSDEVVAGFAAAARRAGVDRLVLLSGRGEPEARRAEDAARRAGPPLVAVRSAWFVENLTEGDFAPMVDEGVVALPVGAVPEPFVGLDDLAEVVVETLLDPRHEGRGYEVTGPESLTFAELTAEVARAQGRPVDYVELQPQEAADGWRAAGLPEDAVWLLSTLFGTVLDGRNTAPGDGVPLVLGRPARSCREVLGAGAPARHAP